MKTHYSAIRPGLFCFLSLCAVLFLPGFQAKALADQPDIRKTEWAAYLQQSPELREADAALNATYRRVIAGLPQPDKKALIDEQRVWIRDRNAKAFARHLKGSDAYCRMLAEETRKRETTLAERFAAPARPPKTAIPARSGSPVPEAAVPVPEPQKQPAPQPPQSPTVESAPSGPSAATGTPATRPAVSAPADPSMSAMPATSSTQPSPTTPVAPVIPGTSDAPAAPAPARARHIDITTVQFARGYNALAQAVRGAAFPTVPTAVSGSGNTRTEQYRISGTVSLQFKYANGNFEKPEIITVMVRRFMTAPAGDREEAAYALSGVLKTLHKKSPQTPEAKDAEIFNFLRSINNAFTADTSRVWKNGGLVHVVTYMQKSDLFAMVVTRDSGSR